MLTCLNRARSRKDWCVKRKEWVYRVLTMKNKTLDLKKGDTPVRASEALVIEPAKSWERLQQAKDLFEHRWHNFLSELWHAVSKARLSNWWLRTDRPA